MSTAFAHNRIRAPRGHGEAVVDPPLDAVAETLSENRRLLTQTDGDLRGRSLADLRREARLTLLREARGYTSAYRDVAASPPAAAPLLVAGHQPQLFHAGVWFKNFALSALGQRLGANAVNLLIDNDVVPSTTLRVPRRTGAGLHVETLPFDGAGEPIPYEEREIRDAACWGSLPERVRQFMDGAIAEPLLDTYWPLVLDAARRSQNLGRCLAEGRHRLEGQWRQQTLELPLSVACSGAEFAWFAVHLLAHLPRLREIYNAALGEYRLANRLRSRSHPVPDLVQDEGWLEAPFWLWTADAPRRRRLFVRRRPSGLELTDRERCQILLPLTDDGDAWAAVAEWQAQFRGGIRLRPRALITTMYARLVLSDLFLHGIGGAKYDQLTDVISQRFFGLRSPRFATLSATALLFPDRTAELRTQLQHSRQVLRELRYSPERHAPPGSEVEALLAEKRRWLADTSPRGSRAARHRGLTQVNLALQPFLQELHAETLQRCGELSDELRRQAALASREFAFCLFPEAALRPLLLQLSQQSV